MVHNRISSAKNSLINAADYRENTNIQSEDFQSRKPHIGEIYSRYEARCFQAGAMDFDDLLSEKMKMLGMEKKYKERNLNDGFSGGAKKKNEILQMAILEPKLSILDETDSGLDIDALRVVSEGVNKLRNENNALILITHYQRLLDYIKPDYVHVLSDGKIVKSGDKRLALELESQGYDWVTTAN